MFGISRHAVRKLLKIKGNNRNIAIKPTIIPTIGKTNNKSSVSAGDYKYLSWMYGVDRKICHEGH